MRKNRNQIALIVVVSFKLILISIGCFLCIQMHQFSREISEFKTVISEFKTDTNSRLDKIDKSFEKLETKLDENQRELLRLLEKK